MNNDSFAFRYHAGTNHPDGEFMDPGHQYAPGDRPDLFKRYESAEQIKLPDPASSGASALEALSQDQKPEESAQLDLPRLAALLHYSAGITKRLRFGEQVIAFRAAACTGALYHIELYAICGEMRDLQAGVYHYDAEHSALSVIRRGDFRNWLSQAAAGHPALAETALILAFTDMHMRNAIKYQAREYRHAFWDSGTILAQTLAMASAHGFSTEIVLGFPDGELAKLLDIDAEQEFPLALLAIGEDGAESHAPEAELDPSNTISRTPLTARFPIIFKAQEATSLHSANEAKAWRERIHVPRKLDLGRARSEPTAAESAGPIERVIQRRGSSRRFQREPIALTQLSTILARSVYPLPLDINAHGLNHVFIIVNAVDDLEAGTYRYDSLQSGLVPLGPGDVRAQARALALHQDLAGDASVNFYYLCDLKEVIDSLGERGYRLAQLEGSVMAGRAYLAAYALGLGATGLTFFDEEVVRFFEPQAEGMQVMFLLALGIPMKRSRAGD